MPKIEVDSKFTKDDVVFFMYNNGIMRGIIHNAVIHNAWGIPEDPRCVHQKAEDKWGEVGDETYEVTKPIIEYTILLDHPLVEELSPGRPVFDRVIGSGRLFRNPKALINFLEKKYSAAYGEEISRS